MILSDGHLVVSLSTTPDSAIRAWRPEDGDSRCQDCGAVNMVWFADNETWNLVMGGPDATEDPGGVVCVPCFGRRAEQAGVRRAWKLVPE